MMETTINVPEVSKLLCKQIENVTCLQCCKYYILPKTSPCGHTLCHTCWIGQPSCPICTAPLDRKKLKVNIPLQNLKEKVQVLCETFETIYQINLDALLLDKVVPKNKDKDVDDWLTNSQNHFSAHALNSQQSPQKKHTSKVQVHQEPECNSTPKKSKYISEDNISRICALELQRDWDNIETTKEREEEDTDRADKNKDNVTSVGPMDIEPFCLDKVAYTVKNPRRSSRNKEIKTDQSLKVKSGNVSLDKKNNTFSKFNSNMNKVKSNWKSVTKMEKEFSKLTSIQNKLNVSIEASKQSEKIKNKISPVKPISKFLDEQHNISSNSNNQLIQNQVIQCDDKNSDHISTNNNEKVFKDFGQSHRGKDLAIEQQQNDKPSQANITKIPFLHKSRLENNVPTINTQNFIFDNSIDATNNDDIIISIKVGSTVTNITMKKKEKDVQLRVNHDRGVQTSLGIYDLPKTDKSTSMTQSEFLEEERATKFKAKNQMATNKSPSTKKQTASLDTATAQFDEITDSIEKELSEIIEIVEPNNLSKNLKQQKKEELIQKSVKNTKDDSKNQNDPSNDIDIFESGTIEKRPVNVALVNTSKAISEIFISTVKSTKSKKVKHPEKRDREPNESEKDIIPSIKKQKSSLQDKENVKYHDSTMKNIEPNSELENYDVIMEQVFANIDSDMENIKPSQSNNKNVLKYKRTPHTRSQSPIQNMQDKRYPKILNMEQSHASKIYENSEEKCSENVFSIADKEIGQTLSQNKKEVVHGSETQCRLDNLTPGVCLDSVTINTGDEDMIQREVCTPVQEQDDSDKSILEGTPDINLSFKNVNSKTDGLSKPSNTSKNDLNETIVISLTDSEIVDSKTVIQNVTSDKKDTSISINKFVDHVTHQSTPNARKSLSYSKINDLDQTLCSSTVMPTNVEDNMNIASKNTLKKMFTCEEDSKIEQSLRPATQILDNTQEREFLDKAFEQIPKTPTIRPLAKKFFNKNLKFCVAASCLSSAEVTRVKLLCNNRGWSFVDKYVTELTHLVVGVDDENKSQRSVKYMRALAAGKWIVSYKWVEKCLNINTPTRVNEEPYEVLDWTGDPGPRLSRTATKKLFEGFTFHCMPPFTILDVETLESMLVSAGARVVKEMQEARAEGKELALVLAEPEHTQESKFTYLAMHQSVVPVNYEWVLNCLGSYTLTSIQELVLCPSSLLLQYTAGWPNYLTASESQ